jgi:hypothetical protein
MESNTLLSSSAGSLPTCANCELWQRARRHKTLEQRLIEFYGHMPTLEEMESDRPERVTCGSPVRNEVW